MFVKKRNPQRYGRLRWLNCAVRIRMRVALLSFNYFTVHNPIQPCTEQITTQFTVYNLLNLFTRLSRTVINYFRTVHCRLEIVTIVRMYVHL